jgi:acyl dehydratase
VTPLTVADGEQLEALVGSRLGPCDWRVVDQADVDAFARASGDAQWIHTDPERARRESPFGGPVAHGNLTLAMTDGFRAELLDLSRFRLDINYGYDRVRYPAAVPVGARVRASLELLSVARVEVGWRLVQRITVEVDGVAKPACVADSIDLVLA